MTLREKIIEHARAHPGVTPHFKTLGTSWLEAMAVYGELFAEGILERRITISPKGRRIEKIFLVA